MSRVCESLERGERRLKRDDVVASNRIAWQYVSLSVRVNHWSLMSVTGCQSLVVDLLTVRVTVSTCQSLVVDVSHWMSITSG